MIISKVKRTIEKYHMLEQGDRIIIGVSGGPDSVFLVHALNELRENLNLTLIVAHLDHGIRGEESKRELRFVEDLANKFGFIFESQSADIPTVKRIEKISTQQAARKVRYKFFMDTLNRFNAQKVALGHNANDQAETVLMRLIRGAGIKGLCGIPPLRDGILIRPIIEVERWEIEEFLRQERIKYVIDSSNREDYYRRNKIRNTLMPKLVKEYNPRIVQRLIHTSDILRGEDEFMDGLALDLFSQICVSQNDESLTLNILHLKDLAEPMQVRVLRKAIESFSGDLEMIGSRHIESVMKMLGSKGPSRSLNLPKGIFVETRYNELIIRGEMREIRFCYSFSQVPHCVRLEEIGKEVEFKFNTIQTNEDLRLDISPDVALLDSSEIRFPIVIRNFEKGDRFQPMGLSGTKKLKDFFINNKIPKSMRRHIPLLIFNDLIAWVMGLRIDHRVRVKKDTREVLEVRITDMD